MDFSSFLDSLKNLQTEKVVAMLQDLQVGQLIHNPWFLGTMGGLALLALIMKWRILLVTILSLTGFTWLLSYTLARGTSLEGGLQNQTLLVFVGGGAVLICIVIYLLFIKSE